MWSFKLPKIFVEIIERDLDDDTPPEGALTDPKDRHHAERKTEDIRRRLIQVDAEVRGGKV